MAQVCTSHFALVMFGVVCTIAHPKHLSSLMSHPNLLGLHRESFTSFFSTPYLRQHALRNRRGEVWYHLSATSLEETVWLSGRPNPLTGYEPKTCIDVSSEHTPDQLTCSRRTILIYLRRFEEFGTIFWERKNARAAKFGNICSTF